MWPVTAQFSAAVAASHAAPVTVTVTADSVSVPAVVMGGEVTVDATRLVRRRAQVTILATPWLRAHLDDVDATVTIKRGVRYPDRTSELVPLGTFVPARVVESAIAVNITGDLSTNSVLQVTLDDLMRRVERGRFTSPEKTTGSAVGEALRLAREATGGTSRDDSTSTATVRTSVWESDRHEAISELAQTAQVEVFADPLGVVVARDIPDPTSAPVATISAGPGGVLLAADTETARDRSYNAVIVAGDPVDGATPFAPQLVADLNPDSPTYVGDPPRYVPYRVTSPLIRNAPLAREVGQQVLRRVTAPARRVSLEAVVNPALDAGDVVTVVYPNGDSDTHVIEGLSVPLEPDRAMTVTMQSSRSDPTAPTP